MLLKNNVSPSRLRIPRRVTHRSRVVAPWILVAVDALTVLLATLIALAFRNIVPGFQDPVHVNYSVSKLWPLAVVIWLACLYSVGAYSDKNLGAGTDEYARTMHSSLMAAAFIGICCYLTRFDLSRGFYILLFAVGTPLLVLTRWMARRVIHILRRRNWLTRRVILAGNPQNIKEILAVAQRETWLGYYVVGALLPEGTARGDLDLPVLGTVEDALEVVDARDIDIVIFADGSFPSSRNFRRMAWALESHHAQMVVAPALTDVASQRIQVRPVAGIPLVLVEPPTTQQAGRWAKRLFDIIFASLILIAISPIMIATAIGIWLDDHGPVIFKQVRVGKNGEHFECLKFRSMVTNAEEILTSLQNEGPNAVMFKMENDPRITKIGHFIRRYSIDELPQLWNVVRGDMSLIGPRPALPKEVAMYAPHVNRRLGVRPGMTGLWQVSGRSNLSWDDTVRLDLYYVDNWSMTQDLSILAMTVKAVFASDGAY
ncbi:Undecaprenyl-phosphate galactose phosphotransferase WbaP/exopolysaccharide biosynthesis polyprenyl glycosylphosphotransferase [Luteococcus japonicus]|uniref:Undecaprenyl-phosphate galactose phosphotransferase WbaP/exopolysaccharide biosynthesis polyprenyl glycosylphosphotransferase n=1 Tax=Luteococcus japonicus TaxID=33984 RepID=A0A3N1ZWN0_9ACTN|nr:Undecaprenyl-phosphate galactose phosphotransferase WbaP/exopolysaccharide biosynthesis polyprenyl glycosylphosphotransferase [Luteococcus japonicus]